MRAGTVQVLAWDSEWLGFPVARYANEPLGSGPGVAAAIAQARVAGIRLLYLVLDPTDAAGSSAAYAAGAQLADAKLTYQLQLSAAEPAAALPAGVVLEAITVPTSALEQLAWQSGKYSRFRCDTRFGPLAFEVLYSGWLRQVLAQGQVWAASAAGETVGMLGLGTRGGQASIELVAVVPEAQHQRIGQCLVQTARRAAQVRGYAVLQVVTQGANQPAQQFYERGGFRLALTEHVYHLWF